uniref:Uncharacterized protein n=1 Tax=Anguilla anguilla TaxID=7936 RepID=A0A0E9WIH5_ANGAN
MLASLIDSVSYFLFNVSIAV